MISNLTFSLTNRCNQSDGLTSYTNLGPFVTFLIGYFVEFPRFRRRFFLGSGPVGDDVLWYHHIGGFFCSFFLSFGHPQASSAILSHPGPSWAILSHPRPSWAILGLGKKNKKIPLCGGTIGHCPLWGCCPKRLKWWFLQLQSYFQNLSNTILHHFPANMAM